MLIDVDDGDDDHGMIELEVASSDEGVQHEAGQRRLIRIPANTGGPFRGQQDEGKQCASCSPTLNLIEMVFAKIKALVRSATARCAMQIKNPAEMTGFLLL